MFFWGVKFQFASPWCKILGVDQKQVAKLNFIPSSWNIFSDPAGLLKWRMSSRTSEDGGIFIRNQQIKKELVPKSPT